MTDLAESCIIIVDDESDNADLFVRSLRREGFTNLHVTTDPQEGLRLCLSLQPAIVILDLHMPELDGFDLLRQLRRQEGSEDAAQVLVISADDSGEARGRVKALGAQGFMVKPVNFAEFRARVRGLLEARSAKLPDK